MNAVVLLNVFCKMIILHFIQLFPAVQIDLYTTGPAAAIVTKQHMIPLVLWNRLLTDHTDGIVRETMT